MIDIYGTIGPSCQNVQTLKDMFMEGMTGIRLNTSHISVREAKDQIQMIHEAAAACSIKPKLLIDMQGPELRVGKLAESLVLSAGMEIEFKPKEDSQACTKAGIPVPQEVLDVLYAGCEVLLDDGKLLLQMTGKKYHAKVIRGGVLKNGKSIALPGIDLRPPTMTSQDIQNIQDAHQYGVTGVMQPFVRDAKDLQIVRQALNASSGQDIKLFAKIENMAGVQNLESFFGIADEIVIARGDLGNAMPLWELPKVQMDIENRCKACGVPFMVVTQMLASMEHSAVPTRAEVSDIYHAVYHGASSVMVTGETAVGEYPIDVIRYMSQTVKTLQR